MFCEAYRCEMSKSACVVRRRNALDRRREKCKKPGHGDVVCAKCEQGAKTAAGINPDEVEQYSADLRKSRKEAWNATYHKKSDDIPVSIEEPEVIETPVAPIVQDDEKLTSWTRPELQRGRPPGSRNKSTIEKANRPKVGKPDIVLAIEMELEHHLTKIKFFNEVLKALTGEVYCEINF